MNFKKYLLIFLFIILSSKNFGQEKSEFNCGNGFEIIETEVESQKTVSFRIITSQKIYTKESFEFSEGIVLIPDMNENLKSNEIVKTVATIGVKKKLSKIIAFKTCKAVEIYFKKAKSTKEETDYLNKNIIIELKLDINKSLSKKEKKKNKKKRDFIESIGIEICEVLSKNETEIFSSEKLSNAMVPKLSENVEKMMKVYDLSFEESSDLFMKDLTLYLIDNCKIVNEFTYKQE